MPYVEKRIVSGNLLEVERYFVAKDGKRKLRRTDRTESSPQQAARNQRRAEKRLRRLICANFDGRQGDIFVTLTHAEDGITKEDAKKRADKFLADIRKWCKTNNRPVLKYIRMDERQGQWHHHVIMSGVPLEVIEQYWRYGRVMLSTLDASDSYSGLVKYLLQDAKPSRKDKAVENAKEPRPKNARRWSCSRNLVKPKVTVKEIKRASVIHKLPAAPKGYTLLTDWHIGCDIQGNPYQTFACVKIDTHDRRSGARGIRAEAGA